MMMSVDGPIKSGLFREKLQATHYTPSCNVNTERHLQYQKADMCVSIPRNKKKNWNIEHVVEHRSVMLSQQHSGPKFSRCRLASSHIPVKWSPEPGDSQCSIQTLEFQAGDILDAYL